MSPSAPPNPPPVRCAWVSDDPLYLRYHDEEWGVPAHDARHLFEMLTLEGAQSGLSWLTILRKREGYRKVFADFDAARVARFDAGRIGRILENPAIVRNRLKVESTVHNARTIVALRKQGVDLAELLWSMVEGAPVQNRFESLSELPAHTPVSKNMSRQLKKLGFRFVGPTVCYSLMQAVGMVNDHVVSCFRHQEVGR